MFFGKALQKSALLAANSTNLSSKSYFLCATNLILDLLLELELNYDEKQF